MKQTAPGRYEFRFPLPETGSYLFKICQSITRTNAEKTEVSSDFTRGLTISYKPESRHLSVNEEFLKQLFQVTGGRYQPALDDLFEVSEQDPAPAQKKLWPPLLLIALVLFVLDVALRRLDLAGYSMFKSVPRRNG